MKSTKKIKQQQISRVLVTFVSWTITRWELRQHSRYCSRCCCCQSGRRSSADQMRSFVKLDCWSCSTTTRRTRTTCPRIPSCESETKVEPCLVPVHDPVWRIRAAAQLVLLSDPNVDIRRRFEARRSSLRWLIEFRPRILIESKWKHLLDFENYYSENSNLKFNAQA